eukprot:TRINITY_DN57799_c0_g1_i1.p2 TRINITY_DN57799_c0_g1~~TRINITY_DN57799_c0_g1_i1.p2  ORF type:complete len:118 (-),score=27.46 TRINITY_DN57799_c0_g1_i1:82-435(-)
MLLLFSKKGSTWFTRYMNDKKTKGSSSSEDPDKQTGKQHAAKKTLRAKLQSMEQDMGKLKQQLQTQQAEHAAEMAKEKAAMEKEKAVHAAQLAEMQAMLEQYKGKAGEGELPPKEEN